MSMYCGIPEMVSAVRAFIYILKGPEMPENTVFSKKKGLTKEDPLTYNRLCRFTKSVGGYSE